MVDDVLGQSDADDRFTARLVLPVDLVRVEQQRLEDEDEERRDVVVEGDEEVPVQAVDRQKHPVQRAALHGPARVRKLLVGDQAHFLHVIDDCRQLVDFEPRVVDLELLNLLRVLVGVDLPRHYLVQADDLREVNHHALHEKLPLKLLDLHDDVVALLACSSLAAPLGFLFQSYEALLDFLRLDRFPQERQSHVLLREAR